MTDQNNAAQLTAAEREDVFERHFSHDHPSGQSIVALMDDLEATLLSKLRAEGVQADDERALTADERKEFIRRTSYISEADRDTRAAFVDEIVRAALASAPVADTSLSLLLDARHRIANLSHAAVPFDDPLDGPMLRRLDAAIQAASASAPVAGEAQLPWHLPVQHWTDEEKAKLLAAPQASEKGENS